MVVSQIPSGKHYVDQEDIDAVVKTLKSGCLSLGEQTLKFEEKFSKYIGMKYATAVSNGTSGLHMAVRALGINEGDEIITTPFSFIASVNCLLYERVKPVFVDIHEKTLNIDPDQIGKVISEKTKAILVVDTFGTPSDSNRINALSKKHNLRVIGDCCESLGSSYENKMTGSFYDISVFGFFPNKQITTGEGGMAVTNSESLDMMLKSLRNQGRAISGNRVFHERLGYNYRMTEMEAALGLSQLKKIDWMINQRDVIANFYERYLSGIKEIELLYVPDGCKVSRFTYVVRIKNGKRKQVMESLGKNGIGYKTYFYPLHLQPFIKSEFGFKERMFPICEKASKEALALPLYIGLEEKEVSKICEIIRKSL